MSNAKTIDIQMLVPFDLYSRMTPEDAAMFARVIFNPSTGLEQQNLGLDHLKPLDDGSGGKDAYYKIRIYGVEAMSSSLLDKMRRALEGVGAEIDVWHVVDIEG